MAGKKKAQKSVSESESPPPESQPESPPAAPEKASLKEEVKQDYPEKFLKGAKKAGYKFSKKEGEERDPVMSIKSYDAQGLWRAVFDDGQRHEFSYEGEWLSKPKPKPKAEAKKD